FLPIASEGTYLDPVPDSANVAAATGSISTSVHQVEFGNADYISIGAMASNELYGAGAVSLASVSGRNDTQVSFPSRIWERNSLNRRFYLLDQPQAFCLFGGQLRFYPDQDITAATVDTGSSHDLMARNAQVARTAFDLSAGS